MAVAGCRAGWVLAQSLFHSCTCALWIKYTLECHAYILLSWKTAAHHCQISLTIDNLVSGYSGISVYSMAIHYSDEALRQHAAGQHIFAWLLHVNAESEINLLKSPASFSRPRPTFPICNTLHSNHHMPCTWLYLYFLYKIICKQYLESQSCSLSQQNLLFTDYSIYVV